MAAAVRLTPVERHVGRCDEPPHTQHWRGRRRSSPPRRARRSVLPCYGAGTDPSRAGWASSRSPPGFGETRSESAGRAPITGPTAARAERAGLPPLRQSLPRYGTTPRPRRAVVVAANGGCVAAIRVESTSACEPSRASQTPTRAVRPRCRARQPVPLHPATAGVGPTVRRGSGSHGDSGGKSKREAVAAFGAALVARSLRRRRVLRSRRRTALSRHRFCREAPCRRPRDAGVACNVEAKRRRPICPPAEST